jgi:hypothetical protein
LSSQSAQRRSADKQQEPSLFRFRVIEASVAEFYCCKFTPLLLTLFLGAEERRGFVELSSRINMQSLASTSEERPRIPFRKVQGRVFAARGIGKRIVQKVSQESRRVVKMWVYVVCVAKGNYKVAYENSGTRFVSVIRNMFYSYAKEKKPTLKELE